MAHCDFSITTTDQMIFQTVFKLNSVKYKILLLLNTVIWSDYLEH